MLVKYYLSDNIKATFEDFALGLWNAWAGLGQDFMGLSTWVFVITHKKSLSLESCIDLRLSFRIMRKTGFLICKIMFGTIKP